MFSQDLVASLVQKSLLAVETSSQGTRAFKLLESTKSFARSLPIAEEESWHNRHREWFAAAVHSLAPQMFSHGAPIAHDIVEVMRRICFERWTVQSRLNRDTTRSGSPAGRGGTGYAEAC